jgi:hypothetical protein
MILGKFVKPPKYTKRIMTLTKELPVTGGFFVALEGSENAWLKANMNTGYLRMV